MNAFIWNSDGFGDQAKHRTVIDAIREHRLDIVVLFETGRRNFSSQFLNHLAEAVIFLGSVYRLGVDLVTF
jgi:hypothetical protein